MRILIANYSRSVVGGAEKYLQTLIPVLLERGHSAALLYESSFDASSPAIDSPADGLATWCLKEMGLKSALGRVAAWKPDVVYCHGLDDAALESALLAEYRMILYAHTYYGTCVSGRKCYSSPRLEPCGRELGASCLALYYPRRCGGLNPRTMWQLFDIQSQRKARLRDYQAILVASRHMYREYERHGCSPERLQLVPLFPGDSTPQPACPALREPNGRVLFVGRLVDVKGPRYLLQAIPLASAELGRPLSLTMAGDGPDRRDLEDLARKLGLSVEFAGWVNSRRREDLMREADLLAVPSVWPEPFGLTGVEAGCFGLPAAGYAVGGIPDWLVAGKTGELAPADPPTVEGLAGAIARALRDPDHYQTLRVGAWAMAKQFSLERHLEELEPILSARERPGRAARSPQPENLVTESRGRG